MKKLAHCYLVLCVLVMIAVPVRASAGSDALLHITGGTMPSVDYVVRKAAEGVGGAIISAWDWLHGR